MIFTNISMNFKITALIWLVHLIVKLPLHLKMNLYQNAYYTINHHIWIERLYEYSFHDTTYKEWKGSYLQQKTFWFKGLLCWVLLGSIVGPLLFFTCINGLSNISSNFTDIIISTAATANQYPLHGHMYTLKNNHALFLRYSITAVVVLCVLVYFWYYYFVITLCSFCM